MPLKMLRTEVTLREVATVKGKPWLSRCWRVWRVWLERVAWVVRRVPSRSVMYRGRGMGLSRSSLLIVRESLRFGGLAWLGGVVFIREATIISVFSRYRA